MRDLMVQTHRSCMLNSADYLLAGYSFQLTLCDLEKVATIKEEIDELAKALTAALKKEPPDALSVDSILLSHWRSQSFFNEMYTDLYDFCFCLSNKIKELEAGGRTSKELTDIQLGCSKVMDLLVKENPKKDAQSNAERIIVPPIVWDRHFSIRAGSQSFFRGRSPQKTVTSWRNMIDTGSAPKLKTTGSVFFVRTSRLQNVVQAMTNRMIGVSLRRRCLSMDQ